MAVGDFLRPQRSPLSVYDEQMAQLLRQQSANIGPQAIAQESALGFPVGTMTAKILGNVLARGANKRAINRDAQQKRAAIELLKKPETNITENTAVGDVIYDPDTDSYTTISAAPVVAGVEGQTREEFEKNHFLVVFLFLDLI